MPKNDELWLPWKIDSLAPRTVLNTANNWVAETNTKALSKYVVRACNSHADLLAGCQASERILTELNPADDANGMLTLLNHLQATIAKAGG